MLAASATLAATGKRNLFAKSTLSSIVLEFSMAFA